LIPASPLKKGGRSKQSIGRRPAISPFCLLSPDAFDVGNKKTIRFSFFLD
jgi:hypothetical protein